LGDLFDGEGFARGAEREGFLFAGSDCLVIAASGVGSAIAAAIAARRAGSLTIFDMRQEVAVGLAARLRRHYPDLSVGVGTNDPASYRLVVNATPLGVRPGDPPAVRPATARPSGHSPAKWCCRPK
jgi:shikimate 5-dehydrogenase